RRCEHDRHSSAARMAEQSESSADPAHAACVVFDEIQIFEVFGESVCRKGFFLGGRLAIRADPAPRKIEGDCRQPLFRQTSREIGKECPMREALEAVTNHDRPELGFRTIDLAADRQPIPGGNIEWVWLQSTTSPPMSAQPRNPRAIDTTFS